MLTVRDLVTRIHYAVETETVPLRDEPDPNLDREATRADVLDVLGAVTRVLIDCMKEAIR